MAHSPAVLEGRDITKSYLSNNITACDSVSISFSPGSVHTIVGENGAGKSTLMRILSGSQTPDSGKIYFRGKEISLETPHTALGFGIGMVHQQTNIIPELTVLQNIILGAEKTSPLQPIPYKKIRKKIAELSSIYHISCPLQSKASTLDGNGIQTASLLALLYRGADIIIFDEPHALFSGNPSRKFTDIVRDLVRNGKTVVVVTHNMETALNISDDISIMQRGHSLGTFKPSELSTRSITTMMMGFEDVDADEADFGDSETVSAEKKAAGGLSKSTLQMTNFQKERPFRLEMVEVSTNNPKHPASLHDISLKVRAGEITACLGIKEQGIITLEHLLTQYKPFHDTPPRLRSGTIKLGGFILTKDTSPPNLKELRRNNVGYIPSDRLTSGVSGSTTVLENGILHHLNYLNSHLAKGFISKKKAEAFVQNLITQFSIKADVHDSMFTLSGGNIQKLIVARELELKPELLIASEVSWGLDIMTQQYVFHSLEHAKYHGCGILLITSESDIALTYADTIALFYRGRIISVVENRNITKEYIGNAILRGEAGTPS
ncbi:MAG: ATP-binding cassette domain-containing protein [Spirochaetia bacterium]|nr:ATP-binding cassette domain-containing protein [Spirochaetia bacterium]